MKYEQTVQVELQEYICMVKRIDGVVAQKALEQELIRCKKCAEHGKRTNYCAIWKCNTSPNGYCHRGRK